MLRFYSIAYAEALELPVRTFWFMSDCIPRIQAQEDQRSFQVANNAQGGEQTQEYVESLAESVGSVYVVDEVAEAKLAVRDDAGFNELRGIAASTMIG